jgi:hypothetical protein
MCDLFIERTVRRLGGDAVDEQADEACAGKRGEDRQDATSHGPQE